MNSKAREKLEKFIVEMGDKAENYGFILEDSENYSTCEEYRGVIKEMIQEMIEIRECARELLKT